MQNFKNVDEFYSDNSARRRSPEADYGVHWKLDGWPNSWRVSYVRDTSEIYAVHQGPIQTGILRTGEIIIANGLEEGPVLLIGHFPIDEEAGPRDVYYHRFGTSPRRLAREMRSAQRTGLGDREIGRVSPQHYPPLRVQGRCRTSRVEPPQSTSEFRWLWMLTDVQPLDPPIPAIGHQEFWSWDVPDALQTREIWGRPGIYDRCSSKTLIPDSDTTFPGRAPSIQRALPTQADRSAPKLTSPARAHYPARPGAGLKPRPFTEHQTPSTRRVG